MGQDQTVPGDCRGGLGQAVGAEAANEIESRQVSSMFGEGKAVYAKCARRAEEEAHSYQSPLLPHHRE